MSRFNAAEWLIDRNIAEGRGDKTAVRCQGRSTSYRELLGEVQRAQCLLDDIGVAAGDRVAMVVHDDEAFPSFFLGCLRSGAVPVPLSTMLRGPALGEIVQDSGAAVLVVSDPFLPLVPELLDRAREVRHLVVAGEGQVGGPTSVAVHSWTAYASSRSVTVAPTTAESPALWLYSSGTTGVPKGVMHVHGNVPATVEAYAKGVLHITEDDRCLSVAKLFFAYGLGNSLTFPFAVGATAILDPAPPTPGSVLDLMATEAPTLFFATPGFCAALLDAQPDRERLASVRATVTAGESLPANIHARFSELTSGPVLDGIGSTELLHIFISNTLEEQTPGSSGRAVPGYVAELRTDAGDIVTEPDIPGHLHIKGPSAATGYWQRPDATAEAFTDGWVRTGDVYTRSSDETWTFLGRNGDMIKAGGIWVSPAEVESVLIEHDSVLEAAVVGGRQANGLETTVAFVVPAAGVVPDLDALDQHCRARMESFKRPRRIIVIDDLPKTATGKIKRFELRERVQS